MWNFDIGIGISLPLNETTENPIFSFMFHAADISLECNDYIALRITKYQDLRQSIGRCVKQRANDWLVFFLIQLLKK